jgi:membrane protein YdbS with pleckstrin-like domain
MQASMGTFGQDHGRERGQPRRSVYVEDALILLSIAALFVLGVFFRTEWWGQVGLGAVLIVMAVVFVIRFRRVHRAFTGHD